MLTIPGNRATAMRQKELRLALVCYGGVSLAVYMHGVTKEIWHLARASRARQDGEEIGGVAGVYSELLDQIETPTWLSRASMIS